MSFWSVAGLAVLTVISTWASAVIPENLLACRPQLNSLAALTMNFGNPDCRQPKITKEEEQAIRAALIRQFGLDAPEWSQKVEAGNRWEAAVRSYERDLQKQAWTKQANEQAAADKLAAQEREEKRAAQAQWRQKEAEAAKEEEKARQARLADRAARLRSGEVKISNFDDALLYHAPVAGLVQLMERPLLRPDGLMYGNTMLLDGEEKDGSLRAKYDSFSGLVYAILKLTPKSIQIAPEQLRLNGRIAVVGRYVGNRDYVTTSGQKKTAPVLEVAYLQP